MRPVTPAEGESVWMPLKAAGPRGGQRTHEEHYVDFGSDRIEIKPPIALKSVDSELVMFRRSAAVKAPLAAALHSHASTAPYGAVMAHVGVAEPTQQQQKRPAQRPRSASVADKTVYGMRYVQHISAGALLRERVLRRATEAERAQSETLDKAAGGALSTGITERRPPATIAHSDFSGDKLLRLRELDAVLGDHPPLAPLRPPAAGPEVAWLDPAGPPRGPMLGPGQLPQRRPQTAPPARPPAPASAPAGPPAAAVTPPASPRSASPPRPSPRPSPRAPPPQAEGDGEILSPRSDIASPRSAPLSPGSPQGAPLPPAPAQPHASLPPAPAAAPAPAPAADPPPQAAGWRPCPGPSFYPPPRLPPALTGLHGPPSPRRGSKSLRVRAPRVVQALLSSEAALRKRPAPAVLAPCRRMTLAQFRAQAVPRSVIGLTLAPWLGHTGRTRVALRRRVYNLKDVAPQGKNPMR